MKLIQPYTADSLNPTYAHTALPRTLFKAVGEAFLKSLELRYHLKKKKKKLLISVYTNKIILDD